MNETAVLAVATSVLLMASPNACHAEPMKELAVYKDNLGKWNCDAKDLGSGKSFKAVAEYTTEFDGNTYIERYYEMGSSDHPNPWKGILLMSFDPKAGRWVRTGLDNSGNPIAASSSGWNENTWVWENDFVNVVIQKQSKNARTFAIDVKGDGGVKRVVEASCKRI
jgi:hypothetical protein